MNLSTNSASSAILEAIFRRSIASPQDVALRSRDETIRYTDLMDLVGSVGAQFARINAQTLGLALDNSVAWVIADLAAMGCGMTIVPIPSFFTPAQQEHLLDTAHIDLVLGEAALPENAGWTPLDEGVLGCHLHHRPMPQRPRFAGKITFTSGSSGTPKGVVLSSATLEKTAAGIVSALKPFAFRQHLGVLPFATLLENIAGIYAPLLNGSEIYLCDASQSGVGAAALDVERFCQLLQYSSADTTIFVPQLLTATVTLCELGMLSLDGLRLVAVGGGKVAPELLRRAAECGIPVGEGYGLSECCSVLSLNLPGDTRPGSVGKPLPQAEIRIAANREIEVRQPVMDGYLDQPSEASDWYPTGDLGYFDADGFLYVDGRIRNIFITSYGRNVNPEWIESGLTQHAAIAQALAVGEARAHNLVLLWLRYPLEQQALDSLVANANAELPDYAGMHAVCVIEGSPHSDLITANGRLIRDAALTRYAAHIEAHYAQSTTQAQSITQPQEKDQDRYAIL